MARRPFPTQAELMPYADHFWLAVAKATEDECWLWTRSKDGKGYGAACAVGRVLQASKVAYVLTNGDVEVGLSVRHTCDNPPCCNPAHLILGTHRENMFDRAVRGRIPTRKLSDEQVVRLLHLRQIGATQRDLGRLFGLSQTVVGKITRGLAYPHIPRPHFPITEGAAQ